LREKLLTELGNITSADLAPTWASEALAAKNTLTATRRKLVEDAFERKLLELPSSETDAPSDDDSSVIPPAEPQESVSAKAAALGQVKGINKSILTVAAPRRYRNREHPRYVAQQDQSCPQALESDARNGPSGGPSDRHLRHESDHSVALVAILSRSGMRAMPF
jgi:hypothetical protein